VHDAYYRELTTTNAIADFKLSISNEYERSEGRSQNQIYLLARLDANLLAGKRTSVYNEMLKRDASIEELLKEADKAYRANDDTTTIPFIWKQRYSPPRDRSMSRSTSFPISWRRRKPHSFASTITA
jgi:hypothetical protein